jgi:hypothetical protein
MVPTLWQERCNSPTSQVIFRINNLLWILLFFSNVVTATDLTLMALAGIVLCYNEVNGQLRIVFCREISL